MLKLKATSLTVLALISLAGCNSRSQPVADQPPYTSIKSVRMAFNDHRKDFENVKDRLLNEQINVLVYSHKMILKEPLKVSKETLDACDKLMEEINAHSIMKLRSVVRFELNYAHERNKVKDCAIIYDSQGVFATPKSKFGTERKLEEFEPNWYFISDSVDTSNFPIRIERAKPESAQQ